MVQRYFFPTLINRYRRRTSQSTNLQLCKRCSDRPCLSASTHKEPNCLALEVFPMHVNVWKWLVDSLSKPSLTIYTSPYVFTSIRCAQKPTFELYVRGFLSGNLTTAAIFWKRRELSYAPNIIYIF